MKLKPIITSLLMTDAYKFSMTQAIFHQFPTYKTTWSFKCRNKDIKFTPEMIAEISEQLDMYCKLQFMEDELSWMKANMSWIREDYIDFLRLWHPRREEIFVNDATTLVYADDKCGLTVEARGTWLNTSFYEIAVLAIVNEVYFAFKYGEGAREIQFVENTIKKFNALAAGEYDIGTFSEFGLRRRYSGKMQDWLVKYIVEKSIPGFVGTSNVYLAKKYGVKACGTMAHEYVMCAGEGTHWLNPAYANKFMLESWVKEYGILNGIALTDTITTDAFLLDFNQTYATLFSGVRHDSGDPIAWGEKMIAHYEKLSIDPMRKTLLFSDSLDFEKATAIKRHFEKRCHVAFGIGTWLSNDCGVEPLNIVMKVTECNGEPCAKISDCHGKSMCKDDEYVSYLKRAIEWRLRHEK